MPTYPPTSSPITPSTPVTASLLSPISVPTHGPGGTMSVVAKTHVLAPPGILLQTIRNTNEWHKWNSFCPRCTISPNSPPPPLEPEKGNGDQALETGKPGWLEIGSIVTIDVFMNGDGLVEGRKKSRDQGIVVTRIERLGEGEGEGYRIAWKSTGYSHWQLHSERVMEFVEKDGGTDYACWETFGGLLGSVVKATYGGTLVERFGDYARDVKGFVEEIGGIENGNA